MDQLKNNKNKMFSYLGLEGRSNSILLSRDSGVSITSDYNNNNPNKIILKKELNIENNLKVDNKSLQNKLINLNKQNKNLNSFLTNSISEISITKQFLSEIKTKKNSDYNLYLNE